MLILSLSLPFSLCSCGGAEGIRKSLKKYDKVFKAKDPKLQIDYMETLKKQYQFFHYR